MTEAAELLKKRLVKKRKKLYNKQKGVDSMQDMSKELAKIEFIRRENELSHLSVESEMNFYEYVKRGDLENAKRAATPIGTEGYGKLSDDPLRNFKYHLVITIAFITRFCVEGGMERETAYNLSDLYIRSADTADSLEELNQLHEKVIEDFTRRMSRIRKDNSCSLQVTKAMEYIYTHLNEHFTVADIAKHLELSSQYLSKIFHKETGMTFSQYITKKRVDAACQLLQYTDYEANDIGNYLAFSSHSHFIQRFREETGLTPKQYRAKFFHSGGKGIKGGADPEEKD